MMKNNLIKNIFLILVLNGIYLININAQVGVNASGTAPDNSAMLDVSATDKGLLIPRMDSTSRKSIVSPAKGLMVFDSTYNSFYFHDGTAWSAIGGESDNLGNHKATQDLQMNGNWLGNDGETIEGIKIDTTGNVGVNIFPQGPLHVSTGISTTPSIVISATGSSNHNFIVSNTAWQSFTSIDNIYLTNFALDYISGVPIFDYTLYKGAGTGGTILASGTSTNTTFDFNDILLEANQQYTVAFTLTSGVPSTSVRRTLSDTYLGGTSNSPLSDFAFDIYAKQFKSGLLVSETGVSFENYTFPFADGTASQVLSTNGAGGLGWSNPPFSGYILPPSYGTTNQVLSTNGAGTLSWANNSITSLQDSDQNTKIQVEKNPNEDIIRFDLNGEEKWRMQGNTLSNSQPNVFIGQGVGQNVTPTAIQLVGIGDSALVYNTSGSGNTALGDGSLYSNTTGQLNTGIGAITLTSNTSGSKNIALGYAALLNTNVGGANIGIGYLAGSGVTTGSSNVLIGDEVGRTNVTGSHNVMIGRYAGLNANNVFNTTLLGFEAGAAGASSMTAIGYAAGKLSGSGGVYLGNSAGANETGNDKLYIDNTATATPLIWGDFANDSLKVHGTFNINNAFSFPIADGTAGQVLQTDGSGEVIWTNANAGQALNINGNDSLFISGTNGVALSPYLDNTDNQQLTLSSNDLSLSNGGSPINLSAYLDNTDNQQLSLSSNNLSLTNGGSPINLSTYNQNLSLSGNTLSLTNDATTVDLSAYLDADNLGNHTVTQNLNIGNYFIQNNSSSGNGLSIGVENQLSVDSYSPRSAVFKCSRENLNGNSYANYIEVNNKFGTRAIFGSDGLGLYSASDTLNTVIGNLTAGGALTFHINAGIKAMTLGAAGRLGIGRTAITNRLEVEGNASKSTAGDWLANSDARLKKNINPLSSNDVLNKMLSLQGVTYEWSDYQTGTKRPEGIQYGFTAQNIQEVFPSLVTEDNAGFLQTPYGTYDAMTVEAMRALNDKIEKLEAQNSTLISDMETLKNMVQAMSARLPAGKDSASTESLNTDKK